MQALLANPRGFCAGVDRAIEIVNEALRLFGAPIYVRHEVVHNRFVVDDLRERGAVFVDELSEVIFRKLLEVGMNTGTSKDIECRRQGNDKRKEEQDNFHDGVCV